MSLPLYSDSDNFVEPLDDDAFLHCLDLAEKLFLRWCKNGVKIDDVSDKSIHALDVAMEFYCQLAVEYQKGRHSE